MFSVEILQVQAIVTMGIFSSEFSRKKERLLLFKRVIKIFFVI